MDFLVHARCNLGRKLPQYRPCPNSRDLWKHLYVCIPLSRRCRRRREGHVLFSNRRRRRRIKNLNWGLILPLSLRSDLARRNCRRQWDAVPTIGSRTKRTISQEGEKEGRRRETLPVFLVLLCTCLYRFPCHHFRHQLHHRGYWEPPRWYHVKLLQCGTPCNY